MGNKPAPVVGIVAEAVRTRIVSGQYAVGSVLPPELELASELGVGRGTVRRAISALLASGDIERRPHARPLIASSGVRNYEPDAQDIHVWTAQTIGSEPVPSFLKGISKGLSGTRYRMVVREPSQYVGSVVKADERRFLDDLLSNRNSAGAILWREPFAHNEDLVDRLIHQGKPLVFVDSRAPANLPADHVGTANVKSARRCVEHLLGLGHQRIVCVTDSEIPLPLVDRIRGYWRAMSSAGLSDIGETIVADQIEDDSLPSEPLAGAFARTLESSSFYYNLAHKVVGRLLNMSPMPTALFITYDVLAFWVCAVLEGCGIQIPEQVSVVGFDWRAHWSNLATDSLTTACQDFEGFGSHSAELLLDRLAGNASASQRHVLLDAPLVVRSSTSMPGLAPPVSRLATTTSGQFAQVQK